MLVAYTDGASRAKQTKSSWGFVLYEDGREICRSGGFLGAVSNNVAEYTAVLRLLEYLKTKGLENTQIRSDSMLVVKQINHEWRIKEASLAPFAIECQKLLGVTHSSIEWIPREQNENADRLCNEILDNHGLYTTN